MSFMFDTGIALAFMNLTYVIFILTGITPDLTISVVMCFMGVALAVLACVLDKE